MSERYCPECEEMVEPLAFDDQIVCPFCGEDLMNDLDEDESGWSRIQHKDRKGDSSPRTTKLNE